MNENNDKKIEQLLNNIPLGKIIINRYSNVNEYHIDNDDFHYYSDGKGLIESYSIFPGIELALNFFHATRFEINHQPVHSVMQINYCHSGKIGWEMHNQTNIYLGPGDLSIHTLSACAKSDISLPLGYYQGISIFIDLDVLTATPPEILSDADINGNKLYAKFCKQQGSTAMPANDKIEHIFSELYDLPEKMYLPYFKLKVQELLLFLDMLDLEHVKRLDQYFSSQVEIIKKIHTQLTENLEQRYTIEELAKQYLMNTTSLKCIFKTVYGMPIASYMKKYRMTYAAKMLLHCNNTVSEISSAVGYKNQSKFTAAFRDIFHMSPTAYQKHCRKQ